MIKLEVCVDSAEGLAAAVAGGADRIELCAALEMGGLTPSPGLIALAANVPVPVMAMIRPRGGDFCYSAADIDCALGDIERVRSAGLAGVVFGASLADGRLDAQVINQLADAARGLEITLHRAIDLVPDVKRGLAVALDAGITRVLSSGGAQRVEDGLARLAEMVNFADGDIAIMPGSGVTPENAAGIVERLGVRDIHASCSKSVPQNARAVELGFSRKGLQVTSAETVRSLKAVLDGIATKP